MPAELAAHQLAAWMQLAADWPSEVAEGVRRCTGCGKGIMLLTDSGGRLFLYTEAEKNALTVLHLRNHHADLDPT